MQALLRPVACQGANLRIAAARQTALQSYEWMAPLVADLEQRQVHLPPCWPNLAAEWKAGQALLQRCFPHDGDGGTSSEEEGSTSPDPWWKEHWRMDDGEEHDVDIGEETGTKASLSAPQHLPSRHGPDTVIKEDDSDIEPCENLGGRSTAWGGKAQPPPRAQQALGRAAARDPLSRASRAGRTAAATAIILSAAV